MTELDIKNIEDIEIIKNSKFFDIITNIDFSVIKSNDLEELVLFILSLSKCDALSIMTYIIDYKYVFKSVPNPKHNDRIYRTERFLMDNRFKYLLDALHYLHHL